MMKSFTREFSEIYLEIAVTASLGLDSSKMMDVSSLDVVLQRERREPKCSALDLAINKKNG